jgi:hypothetical protein
VSERPPERPSYETPESAVELQPATEPATDHSLRPGRVHLVVVVTRAVTPADVAPPSAVLVSRFWHPSLHRWSENSFESLEHAIHLLVFEARREDFSRPSTEAMLHDVGLTPEDVADLMGRVERENDDEAP